MLRLRDVSFRSIRLMGTDLSSALLKYPGEGLRGLILEMPFGCWDRVEPQNFLKLC